MKSPLVPPGPLSLDTHAAVEAFIAAQIPDGKKGAVIGIVGMDSATFAIATKLGDSWKLAADVNRKWDGDVSGHVEIVGTW